IVPGSTFRYGSSLIRVTLRPRDSRIAASDAAAMPLPSEDTTPPVTKTNLVMACGTAANADAVLANRDYRRGSRAGRGSTRGAAGADAFRHRGTAARSDDLL